MDLPDGCNGVSTALWINVPERSWRYRRAPTSGHSSSALAPTGADSAVGSILPVQGAYYATMFASMPAKMLISMATR